MNDQEAQMRERMQQLGVKFAQRTQGELVAMRELVDQARQGNTEALRNLELLSHKIHGTGATFGLTGISNTAGEIEHLVSEAVAGRAAFDDACAARIVAIMARLQTELDSFNMGA
jgi:chemotaxis protein histidine kinase CheA